MRAHPNEERRELCLYRRVVRIAPVLAGRRAVRLEHGAELHGLHEQRDVSAREVSRPPPAFGLCAVLVACND